MSKNTSELFRKAILVTLGATALTIEKVNSMIDELVEKGEMSEQQAKSFKQEVKEKAISEKDSLESKIGDAIQKGINKVFKEVGIVTKKDLDELEKRLHEKMTGQTEQTENPIQTNEQHNPDCDCEDCVK